MDANGIGSKLAVLVLLSYVPFGINSLSYNSMGILFLAMAFCAFVAPVHKNRVSFALSGFWLAAAVLCCPYLAVLYPMYILVVLLPSGVKSRFHFTSCDFKSLLIFTLGIGALALPFLIYLFSHASISQILKTLSFITQDPSHASSTNSKFYQFFQDLYAKYNSKRELVFCLVLSIISIVCRWKRWKYPASVFFILCVVAALISTVKTFILHHYINFLPLPLNFLVPAAYCIPPKKDPRAAKLFWWFWAPSLIYMVCLHLSSNQKAYAIASASLVPLIAGIVIIFLAAENLEWSAPIALQRIHGVKILTAAVIICLLFCQLWLRYQNNFWDSDISKQTELITQGPHRGTIVTPEKREEYNELYENIICVLNRYHPASAFYACSDYQNLCYLFGSCETAATSSWAGPDDPFGNKKRYYAYHPEKNPEMIYICKDSSASFLEWLYTSSEYTHLQTEAADIYLKNTLLREG